MKVTAAIVTCGGLCPGLNDVVAGLVNKLDSYGVPEGKILGIRYGFRWVRTYPHFRMRGLMPMQCGAQSHASNTPRTLYPTLHTPHSTPGACMTLTSNQ